MPDRQGQVGPDSGDLEVDLTELFDFPTIAQLAQHLQSKLAQA